MSSYTGLSPAADIGEPSATCHPDRPAWPYSEAHLCHECNDIQASAASLAAGLRACGYDVTEEAVRQTLINLDVVQVVR